MAYHQKKYQQQGADQRSLCLHRCIAHKIKSNPALLTQVFDTLESRYAERLMSYGSYLHWQAILSLSADHQQFYNALTAEDKTTTALRRKTIFTGILNEKERRDCLAALLD
ncbi:hypothetical protein [Alteromonas gilva]|uniref:Uncharacterized protein n=1 Tax=Alteromonas gilva TaxID=2987522 RepID=A0ABT5L405_9ALTE|nr:hypothetical protein [Alteromonas gilva]MDC8831765.1 hypothetical protein [Alteromonas gilva]